MRCVPIRGVVEVSLAVKFRNLHVARPKIRFLQKARKTLVVFSNPNLQGSLAVLSPPPDSYLRVQRVNPNIAFFMTDALFVRFVSIHVYLHLL